MPGQGRIGDKASASDDAHGCPGCPHPTLGPAVSGSANVFVNGRPALRVDDVGIHAACCGPNQWRASRGSATVFINGKPAHRLGDETRHCGTSGQLVEGSSDVIVGDSSPSSAPVDPKGWIDVRVRTTSGRPIAGRRYRLETPDGRVLQGRTDDAGLVRASGFPSGKCKVSFPDDEEG